MAISPRFTSPVTPDLVENLISVYTRLRASEAYLRHFTAVPIG